MTIALLDDVINAEAELSNGELVGECNARAGIYRLLAGVFLEEPTAEYLKAIRSPAVMSSLLEMGVVFPDDFTAPPLAELLDTLACEYAVLFVVTGGCPAVESIRLYGRFQQQSFFEVREIYQKAGFKVSGGRFMVFDDQLGVELMFVAVLLGRAANALASGNQDRLRALSRSSSVSGRCTRQMGAWLRHLAGAGSRTFLLS